MEPIESSWSFCARTRDVVIEVHLVRLLLTLWYSTPKRRTQHEHPHSPHIDTEFRDNFRGPQIFWPECSVRFLWFTQSYPEDHAGTSLKKRSMP